MYTATQVSSLTKIDNNTIIRNLSSELQVSEVIDDSFEKTFELSSQTFPRGITDIYYANGLWVACTNTRGILKSTDGTTWTDTNKTTGHFFSCYYANGLWLIGSDTGGIYKSTDGNTWIQTAKTDDNIRTIIYINGLWLAGDLDGRGIWKSTDGNTWTQTAKTKGHIVSIHYANGLFVAAAGYNEGIWKSTDGNTWSKTAQTTGSFRSVNYACGLWLATSLETGIWTSTDSNTWSNVPNVPRSPQTIYCSCYANGVWLVGTDGFGIYKSTDGKIWSKTTMLVEHVYTIHYNNGMFIVGTIDGIWKSKIHAAYSPSYEAMNDKDSIDTIHTDILKALDSEISARKDADNLLSAAIIDGTSPKYIAGQGISITGDTISAIPDSLKQDKLTAGSNISIINNVITANIPPLSGGGSINIDNNTLITNSENKVQVADIINESWKVVNSTNKNFNKIICNNNVILAGCSDLGGLYRSEDFGESWNVVSADSGSSGVDLLSSITVDSFGYNNSQYVASIYSPQLSDSLGKFSVVASNDSGKTWNKYLTITRAHQIKTAPRLISLVHTHDRWLGGGIDGGLCECMDYDYISNWKARNRLLDEKITEFYMYWPSGGEDIYFVGTQSGGMWKSIDLGDTWYQLSSVGSIYNVSKIRGDDNTIYSVIESSLYVSKNGGDSWTQFTKDSGLSSSNGSNIYANSIECVSGSGSGTRTIYVGTRSGEIFLGNDNFTKTTVPNNVGCINNIVNTGMGLFATCSNGYILKSADFGITWTTVYYDRLEESIEDIAAVGQDLLIAVGKGGSYISSDKGTTWTKQTGRTGLRYITQVYGGVFLASGDGGLFRYVYDPLISPENIWTSLDRTPLNVNSIHCANGLWLAGGGTQGYGDGIWKSTDGNIWNQTGNTNGNFNSIYYANGLWLAGTNNNTGIWKSADGNTWTQTTKTNGEFRSIYYANGLWVAGSEGLGIWKSIDGNTWSQTSNTGGYFYSLHYANGLWLASGIPGIWKSTDGNTWTQTAKTDGYFSSIHFANGLWLAGSGGSQLDYRFNIGIWKSTDGNTWDQTNNTDGGFLSIYYANGLWLAGTSDNTGIWKSTDGNKWSKTTKTDGNFPSIYYANGLWLAGSGDSTGIWKSTDGETWNNVKNTRVLQGTPHYYFGGCYISDITGGYSTSLDNGATWTKKTFPVYTYKTFYKDSEKDILAGTKTGIIKSIDYGASWLLTSQKSGEYNSIDCWNGLYIAGSTNLGLWYSNNGTTWTQTNKKDGTFSSVKYANGIWLASGLDNVWKSIDGLNWTETNKKRDTSGSANNDIGHTNSSWFVGTGNSIVQSNIGTFLNKYPVISDILEILKRNNLK